MPRATALYARFTTRRRDAPGQVADLQKWAEGFAAPVRWYADYYTGSGSYRPGFDALRADVRARGIARVVVSGLDRLGLTARGLSGFLYDLRRFRVDLVSLGEGLDLATPDGRWVSRVLATVGAYESEVRAAPILDGQATARARGARWGGSAKGRRWAVTGEREGAIRRLRAEGHGVTAIARATGLTRRTVYRILSESGFRPVRPARNPRGQATGLPTP